MNSTLREFRRPILLAILASMLGELVIFVVYGVILYPDGSLLHKFFWTVIFCGVGMGSTAGALVCLLVLGRWDGWRAIVATVVITTLVLGVGCDYLCFSLDRHFHYFGAHENPAAFWTFGLAASAFGGLAIGWLIFSDRGRRILEGAGL